MPTNYRNLNEVVMFDGTQTVDSSVSRLTAISLFSGIGAMDLAFSLAGFDIRAQVEINEFCRKVLAKHAPRYWRNSIVLADVRTAGRSEYLPANPDVIFGGFPCQPHSSAGKRKGASDSRDLWPEFRRIIGDLRPRAVLLENVPNIVNTIGTGVIADLTALGYDSRWGIISAADAGAPHNRERWWCVAYSNSLGQQKQISRESAPDTDRKYPACESTGQTVIHEAVTSGQILGDSQIVDHSKRHEERGNRRWKGSQKIGLHSRFESARTGRSSGTESRPGNDNKPGMDRSAYGLAPRLDGFEGFPARPNQPQLAHEPARTVSAAENDPYFADRMEALGNSVVWQVVYPLAVEILEALS